MPLFINSALLTAWQGPRESYTHTHKAAYCHLDSMCRECALVKTLISLKKENKGTQKRDE